MKMEVRVVSSAGHDYEARDFSFSAPPSHVPDMLKGKCGTTHPSENPSPLLIHHYPFVRFQALALGAACGSDWGEVTKESKVKNNCDNHDVSMI